MITSYVVGIVIHSKMPTPNSQTCSVCSLLWQRDFVDEINVKDLEMWRFPGVIQGQPSLFPSVLQSAATPMGGGRRDLVMLALRMDEGSKRWWMLAAPGKVWEGLLHGDSSTGAQFCQNLCACLVSHLSNS